MLFDKLLLHIQSQTKYIKKVLKYKYFLESYTSSTSNNYFQKELKRTKSRSLTIYQVRKNFSSTKVQVLIKYERTYQVPSYLSKTIVLIKYQITQEGSGFLVFCLLKNTQKKYSVVITWLILGPVTLQGIELNANKYFVVVGVLQQMNLLIQILCTFKQIISSLKFLDIALNF